jgi:hypothetical protein
MPKAAASLWLILHPAMPNNRKLNKGIAKMRIGKVISIGLKISFG